MTVRHLLATAMNAKAFRIVLMIAVFTVGCHDAAQQLKLRRQTVDLLRSISDMERQLAGEEESLRFLDLLGKSAVAQRAVIENSKKRLADLRDEINRHSDFKNPNIDQIRYEELDQQKLQDRFKKITEDHSKGMTRAKE